MTEREKRVGRIALWVAGLASPFFVAWLIGPSVVNELLAKDARAKVTQLGLAAVGINVDMPCRGWSTFTFGFSVDYQVGGRTRRGYLCRKFGDKEWTWHPQ